MEKTNGPSVNKEGYTHMYRLKCGETLYTVCKKYGLDVERVLTLNPRINPTRNYEGVYIRLN